jgi:hypothetical protein
MEHQRNPGLFSWITFHFIQATYCERLERSEQLEPAVRGYLNSGITFSANSRMFFSAISCGMPPK